MSHIHIQSFAIKYALHGAGPLTLALERVRIVLSWNKKRDWQQLSYVNYIFTFIYWKNHTDLPLVVLFSLF